MIIFSLRFALKIGAGRGWTVSFPLVISGFFYHKNKQKKHLVLPAEVFTGTGTVHCAGFIVDCYCVTVSVMLWLGLRLIIIMV